MILNDKQTQSMQAGGKILATIIKELVAAVTPGITTQSLANKARDLIVSHGVKPSFQGVNNFPEVICLSINEEAVHALPSKRVLQEGDLLKIDFGVVLDGLHTDSAVTIVVGQSTSQQRQLIAATRDALVAGIAMARAGNTVADIGRAVQTVVEKNGFAVVKELGGHGIGKNLHEKPFIPNFYDAEHNMVLKPGMALAIEPIVSTGDWRIKDSKDGFGYVVRGGSLVAHFEHTIIVTDNAPIIVTE